MEIGQKGAKNGTETFVLSIAVLENIVIPVDFATPNVTLQQYVFQQNESFKPSCDTPFMHTENACIVRASWAKTRLVTKVKTQCIAF